ncbi:MAG TPA: hypothetical protein VFK13_03365 [Gemmatimonadaceae bacterium]|nr:hypothetical protein [Gemmatimonadaceae bacterium]
MTSPTTVQSEPARQAYRLLHVGFTVAPIVAGLDKFFNLLTRWEQYLAPLVTNVIPLSAETIMRAVGVIEIVAGLIVAFKPRIGGYIVGLWLLGIIVNLLIIPDYFDIALRDFGLALGAFALARLARTYSS